MKRVAVVGNSGGNLYAQGGNNPGQMMNEIFTQAKSAGIEIGFIEFIGADRSMDNIKKDSPARLYTLGPDGLEMGEEDTLENINEAAKKLDAELAKLIEKGEIDGMMIMSCDPDNVNNASLTAAGKKQIPVVGTGGASTSGARKVGANVISSSGTTGTTNRTRAVSFVAALANEWGMKYMPVIGKTAGGGGEIEGSIWKRVNFRGIMMASLPGFIAMALSLALSKIPGLSSLEAVFNVLVGALPVLVAAIAAKQVSGLDEVGIVAGIVAGFMSVDGGLIGGLVVGILAGVLAYYIISFCFKKKVPGTTANIAAGGLAGLAAGLVGKFLIAPVALWLGDGIRNAIEATLAFSPLLAGALAGLLIWPAIIGGVYHAAILPIVLLEMEAVGFSFLGAIDMTGLVMVSAGITLANIIAPKDKGDRAVALPGFLINMGFGTFVEAAYPFMFSSKLVFAAALIASTVSGAMVGVMDVKGIAYVPSVVAPTMANPGKGFAFALCMLAAMGIACVLTIIANRIESKKAPKSEE